MPPPKRNLGPTDVLVGMCFAAYLFFGLPLVAPAFWSMVDGGLASGVRWVGQLMLVAFIVDGLGIFLLSRELAPASADGGWLAGGARFSAMMSRWIVGLMVLILGLLGLGIDVRPEPGLLAILAVLGIPLAKEALVHRWVFGQPRRPAEHEAHVHAPAFSLNDLAGKLLCLPMRLVLLTLIEGGLFVDLSMAVRRDMASVALLGKVGMGLGFGLVLAVLYGILVFGPLKIVDIVRLHRSGRGWLWLLPFVAEVVLIEIELLT